MLATHPAVKLAQVVGMPDAAAGRGAGRVRRARARRDADRGGGDRYCRGQIASFKVPRYVRFVTEWPMSATKIQKFKLREELETELATAPSVRRLPE